MTDPGGSNSGKSNEFLSQDEIDTLLTGVADEKVDTKDDHKLTDDGFRYYDFAAQQREASGRLSGLVAINERFARSLRTSLMNLLRRAVEVSGKEIITLKCSEYFSSLDTPCSLNLFRMRPLIGTSLCIFGTKFVVGLVNSLFGGPLDIGDIRNKKEYTQVELRICRLVLEMILQDLMSAWDPIIPIKCEEQGHEINPNLVNVISPNEMVVVVHFDISVDKFSDEIHIAMPYSMIEPIRSALEIGVTADKEDVNERWSSALQEEIFDALLEVTGDLASTQITFNDILDLKAGDIIGVDMKEHVTVLANGIPTFRARFGVSNKTCAIKILGRVGKD